MSKCAFRHNGNVILLVSEVDLFWVPVLQPLGLLKENCAEFEGPIVLVVSESGLGNMFLASREMLTLAAF